MNTERNDARNPITIYFPGGSDSRSVYRRAALSFIFFYFISDEIIFMIVENVFLKGRRLFSPDIWSPRS